MKYARITQIKVLFILFAFVLVSTFSACKVTIEANPNAGDTSAGSNNDDGDTSGNNSDKTGGNASGNKSNKNGGSTSGNQSTNNGGSTSSNTKTICGKDMYTPSKSESASVSGVYIQCFFENNVPRIYGIEITETNGVMEVKWYRFFKIGNSIDKTKQSTYFTATATDNLIKNHRRSRTPFDTATRNGNKINTFWYALGKVPFALDYVYEYEYTLSDDATNIRMTRNNLYIRGNRQPLTPVRASVNRLVYYKISNTSFDETFLSR